MSARHQAPAARRRRSFLQLERLEERTVLAGNVSAYVSGGYLFLLGDGGDNQLEVTRTGSNSVQITSLDTTVEDEGTTINGSVTTKTLNNVTNGIYAFLGEGDNTLELSGSTTDLFRVLGNTTIFTGQGDDTIRFTNFSVWGSLVVSTGGGDDVLESQLDSAAPSITVGGLRVARPAVINMGGGADTVSLRNSTFQSSLVLFAGTENDTVDIRSTNFQSVTSLDGSLGSDTLNNVGNTFRIPPFITSFETRTSVSGPTATNDTATVAPGGTVTVNVLGNDIANGGTLNASTVAIVTAPLRGTAVVNANGTITYTNTSSAVATDVFTYTVRNSQGTLSNVGTVNVTIGGANSLPIAANDTFTVNEGATVTLNLGANDTDAEGRLDLSSLTIVQQPTSGTVTVGTGGNVTYVSNGNEVTSDSFTYTIADLDGGVSLAGTVNLTITPTNDAPTIGAIADVSTSAGTATAPIAVTVNDAETAAGLLNVTATSSNPTLVPSSGIVLGGSGSARTLTITPAANQTGTATITVSATDANNVTTTTTFLLTVGTQANTPPTIDAIAPQSTNEDTATTPIAVIVNDAQTPAGSLTVTATSSNTALVPNNSIVVGGSGSNRTLVITPAANLAGTSTITVTATDASNASTTTTFVLTVNAQNDAPTIEPIGGVTTNEDTTISSIAVTVNDQETAAGSLNVTATSSNTTLVPNGSIVVGGSGSARTLSITPAANQSGTSTITVSATDANNLTTTSTFLLTVNPQNDAPTIAPVPSFSLAEDTTSLPFTITLGDIETPNGLTVTAASSNPTVIAANGVSVTGSGATRTVTVTPVANASGSSTITLNVSDGTTTTSTAFIVTVNAQNDAPTVTAIPDTTVGEGATITPLPFTIGDAETAASGLTVTATSDNPAVITNSGLLINGTGADRTISITPVAGATGTANITLRIVDAEGLFVEEVFAVNINAIPTISTIADVTINENTSTPPLPFTINDAETGGAGLLQFDFGGSGTTAIGTGTAANGQANLNFIDNSGSPADLRGAAGSGVSGLANDFAFDNSASTGLFTASRAQQSADFNGIDGLESFTLSGWFQIPAAATESIGQQSALIENGTISTSDPAGGFRLRGGAAADAGTLELRVNRDFAVESSAVYTEVGQYVFFAVTYDGTQSTDNVKFYKGTTAGAVQLVDTLSLAAGVVNDENIPLTIGTTITSGLTLNSFKGLLDNIRIDGSVSALGELESFRTQALTNASSPAGAATNLSLSATSSNATLVPVGNIVFSGTGNNRTVTVTPVANLSGSSTIRVTVTDDAGQSSFEEFVVTVNELPTISNRGYWRRRRCGDRAFHYYGGRCGNAGQSHLHRHERQRKLDRAGRSGDQRFRDHAVRGDFAGGKCLGHRQRHDRDCRWLGRNG